MPNIEKAKNQAGKTIFPVTVADAVLMGNGKTLKGELSELGSKIGTSILNLKESLNFADFEQGSINEEGVLTSEYDRVRSGFIKAPFEIDLNSGYHILRVLEYDNEKNFIKQQYMPDLPLKISDRTKLYRIVLIKDNETNFDVEENYIKFMCVNEQDAYIAKKVNVQQIEMYDLTENLTHALVQNEYSIPLEYGSISINNGENILEDFVVRTRGYLKISDATSEWVVLVDTDANVELGGGKRFYDLNYNYIGSTQTSEAIYFRQVFSVENNDGIEKYKVRFNGKYYEPFVYKKTMTELPKEAVDYKALIDIKTKNIANPSNFSFALRHSTSLKSIVRITADEPYASTGFIEVEEGNIYCISGDGVMGISNQSCQGGFYQDVPFLYGEKAVENITLFQSHNDGLYFVVPKGKGIKYVIFLLNAIDGVVSGNVQLEEGENATVYEPYNPKPYIKNELLSKTSENNSSNNADNNLLDVYMTFGNLTYNGLSDKISNFKQHWLKKDKDIVVVNTGTSLTARDYCRECADAAYRPPLLHTENLATHIWDKLNWGKQEYRRYDAKVEKNGSVNYFTENGAFVVADTDALWDDSGYRRGYTRIATSGNNSLSFIVPASAWQFNFIYRTDSQGCENCVINIKEGNGKMEVWDGSSWVEANGYAFSMKEENIGESISSVTIKNPRTGYQENVGTVQTHGNTTYQKRLKMRSTSHKVVLPNNTITESGVDKNVTISGTGRFMYWGVEWSSRQYMITYINAARGSHGPSISNSGANLVKFQDNEIWSFKPDLILTEDPIYNGGGGSAHSWFSNGSPIIPSTYWAQVVENFFFAENKISIKARGKDLGFNPEIAIFGPFSTALDGMIDEDGELRSYPTSDGYMMTVADALLTIVEYMRKHHPDIIYINCIQPWMLICNRVFGNISEATVRSGYEGASLLSDGVHPNTNGSRVWARLVLPILDM